MATPGQLSVYHRTSAWPRVNGGHSVSKSFAIHDLRITNDRLGKEMAKKDLALYIKPLMHLCVYSSTYFRTLPILDTI